MIKYILTRTKLTSDHPMIGEYEEILTTSNKAKVCEAFQLVDELECPYITVVKDEKIQAIGQEPYMVQGEYKLTRKTV